MSDSVNYQDTTEGTGYYRGYRILQRVQDTTEGTGDQEINVIGVSNPSQSHGCTNKFISFT